MVKLDYKKFASKIYETAVEEDITTNAAQVAFYFTFALFPLLLFLLNLAGIFLGEAEDVRRQLFFYLSEIIPASALTLIQETVNEVTENGSGGKLTFGALVALWSASAGIDNIRIALNDVYDLKETRSWLKAKAVSVLLTLGIAFLVFFALGVVFYGSQFINLLLQPVGLAIGSPVLITIFSFIVVGFALISAFALIYSFAPNHDPFSFQWITPGAIAAIFLWLVFSGGFRLYLHFFDSYSTTYGSLGAMIILLLWLYLTALVILTGGVINAVFNDMTVDKKEAENEVEHKE